MVVLIVDGCAAYTTGSVSCLNGLGLCRYG